MRHWFVRRLLRLFRVVSRVSLWFETRFTVTGGLVIGGTIAAAVFGVDPRQTLAYLLAAVLVSVIAIAMGLSLYWRPQLELKRELPDTVTVDSPTSYTVLIRNHSTRSEYNLVISDELRTIYPSADTFQRAATNARDRSLNWFDRRVGFPRWLDLLRTGRGAHLKPIPVPMIPAHAMIEVTIPLTPLRRGKLIFTSLEIKRPDPMGIFFAKHRVKAYGELVSLPKRYPVPPLQWISQRHFHRGGVALAATVGDSEEFIGVRDYRPGDPLRHIHWRSFAKRGAPVVKEHQDEFFDRHALVIDTFLGHSPPAHFEATIAVAASFIQCTRPHDSILDLVFIEQKVWQITTGRGLSNNRRVLTYLAELQYSHTDNFDHLAAYLRRYLDQLASIIMVGTTWDTTRQVFVKELHHRRLRCRALQISESDVRTTDLSKTAMGASGAEPQTIRPSMIEHDIAHLATLG